MKRLIQKLSSYNLDEDKFLSILSKIYLLSFAVKRNKELLKTMEDFSSIDITKTELFKMGEEKGQKEGMLEAILLDMKIKFGSKAKLIIKKNQGNR